MSDTSRAAVQRIRQESPTVDAVCRQLETSLPADEAPLVVHFAEIFFSKAPPDFIRGRSSETLAHLILAGFRFLERARPGVVNVEVVNPEIENEGWTSPVTVVRTNVTERPFIVDTIREFLHSRGFVIEHYVYPVLHVERRGGKIVDVLPSLEGQRRESFVHCEIPRVLDPAAREELRAEVASRLQDVVRATDDHHPMVNALNDVIAELAERARDLPKRRKEMEEIQAFLRWLRDGAFVFLGYRAYDIVVDPKSGDRSIIVEPGSGMGILRNEAESSYADPVPLAQLREGLRDLVEGGPTLIISKTNAESTVHRRARMDYIGIKKIAENGEVVGEHRFTGLFTSRAYAEEADRIPILREKLQSILEAAGVQSGSHDYKEINTIFNSMPKEELFLTSAREIGADVQTVLTSYNTAGVRVSLRQDPLRRGVSVLVILPKDKFSGEVRKSIESELVNAFEGEVLNYHLALGSGDQARLHFYMSSEPDRFRAVSASQLEQSVRELIRSWNDRLAEELERVLSEDEALRQAKRYGEAFNGEYRAATEPSEAVRDLLELETMQAQERNISIAFANKRESSAAPGVENVTELKVYLRGRRLVLSDFMPILEHVGLRVIAVNPFEVEGGGVEPAILYLFAVQDAKDSPLDVEKSAVLVADAILGVWAGDVSDDLMNSLVLTAGLHWREVDVLRCYASYAYQLGATPSRFALPSSLVRYPQIARIVFELFQIKFDPAHEQSLLERQEAAQEIRGLLTEAMRGVTALADDRALRRLITLVEATVRTNYYRSGGRAPMRRSGGVPYTSLKFACRQLESIVRNRLLYEVWVRSSRMEGIHLRGAKVSRGGIRWSDRPDDFRTEVLGLVKTQMVKNAVIVPAGSKGGFITLRQFADAERTAEEGKEQYRTLIRGLLDITDNLDLAGKPVPPEDVLCYDDPDPYLVVAADKGTAKFSDVANALAAEYGFWMGDAFASGGSQGYDHKEVGITARGAWECVKRHFLEMDKDIQTEPFTVVGIGDMGGDVFGNGMLLSEQIRLIAAFDHRHVFIDPSPDPAVSFKERQRMFALPRSSWNDYDRSLLSPGGMIVPRGAKEVTLTPEAKQALKIAGETPLLDGESLIRAVLRAPAELLWNGGIGTYVKASVETHSDAGDPSNDAVRISAPELRCEVVGEGGNLGFTQAARIEFALKGGHINTDALDNSGGVDLSDHEVNLKILLNPVVRAGKLEEAGRNELLEELTADVAELVEADNRSQSLAISLDQLRAKGRDSTEEFRDLMTSLEKAGVLDRVAEHLPTLEALVERQEAGGSLTRPELCTLLAYSKLSLMGALLRSTLPDDPAAEAYLTSYFPPAATAAAGEEALRAHRLRREIIASQLTNDIVDLMGAAFVQRLVRSTGRTPAEVTRAWMIAARLADHREVLQQVHSGEDPQPPVAEVYRWLLGLGRVLQRTSRWILQNVPPETKTADVMAANLEGLSELRRRFADIVTGDDRKLFEQLVTEMRSLGAGESLAHSLITLRFLDQLLEILRVAKETGSDPIDTARAFYRVSDVLRVPWLRHAIFASAENDRWEQRAANALADDLSRAHHRFVAEVMRARGGNGADVDRVTDGMLRSREREMMRFREVIEELQQETRMSLSGLSVAVREIGVFSEQLNGSHTNN